MADFPVGVEAEWDPVIWGHFGPRGVLELAAWDEPTVLLYASDAEGDPWGNEANRAYHKVLAMALRQFALEKFHPEIYSQSWTMAGGSF